MVPIVGRPSKGLRLGITVRLSPDLYRRVSIEAARTKTTLADWVIDAIKQRLSAEVKT